MRREPFDQLARLADRVGAPDRAARQVDDGQAARRSGDRLAGRGRMVRHDGLPPSPASSIWRACPPSRGTDRAAHPEPDLASGEHLGPAPGRRREHQQATVRPGHHLRRSAPRRSGTPTVWPLTASSCETVESAALATYSWGPTPEAPRAGRSQPASSASAPTVARAGPASARACGSHRRTARRPTRPQRARNLRQFGEPRPIRPALGGALRWSRPHSRRRRARAIARVPHLAARERIWLIRASGDRRAGRWW